MAEARPARLDRTDGETIAYHKTDGKNGSGPGVVFLGGFMSDMTGTKATALEAFCRARGQGFVRFDYLGHGDSSGAFADGTIGRWTGDAIAVLDALTEGPQILVGSSMGGWIMLLTALARRERIAGLLGIAPAPDFTRRMMTAEFDDAQRQALLEHGRIEVPSSYSDEPYVITRNLIEDGDRRALLDAGIDLKCPVRVLQGMQDDAVPWQTSLRLAEALASEDVDVTLLKSSDHRLSEPREIARLTGILGDMLDG